jgi:hypothetical protein
MKKVLMFLIGVIVFSVSAQDAGSSNDAAEVQVILTKCGMEGLTLQDVAVMENGRVVSLDLKNRDISKDGMTYLPEEIGKLTALRELTCSGNIIDSIPSAIGSLVNLQKLDLASNRIAILPPVIGSLKNLTLLDLRFNRIAVIPPEIAQCQKLKLLQLWSNKLATVDAAVTKLGSLEELYLKDNRLTTLPAAMAKVKYGYVDIIGNKLCDLPPALDAWAKKFDKRYKETQKCW